MHYIKLQTSEPAAGGFGVIWVLLLSGPALRSEFTQEINVYI